MLLGFHYQPSHRKLSPPGSGTGLQRCRATLLGSHDQAGRKKLTPRFLWMASLADNIAELPLPFHRKQRCKATLLGLPLPVQPQERLLQVPGAG